MCDGWGCSGKRDLGVPPLEVGPGFGGVPVARGQEYLPVTEEGLLKEVNIACL